MNQKTKKNLTISLILLVIFSICGVLWHDLNLDLEKKSTNEPKIPEVSVKGISFERKINDKLWKVTAPNTFKEGQTVTATDIVATVQAKLESTKINAKAGSYNLENQLFNFNDAQLLSKRESNQYNISSSNLTYEAQVKKWNFNGKVTASSNEVTIKTENAVLCENEQTCELPNVGKIIWKEKK